MKRFFLVLMMMFGLASMAQAEKISLLIDLPGSWQMDVDTLCGMKKKGTLTFNGVDFEVVRSSTGRVEIGGRLQGVICPHKAVKSSFSAGGGGGGGNDNKSIKADNSSTTNNPPERGDNAGTPAGGTGGAPEGEKPTRAEPGQESTAGGFEKPEQGGDVYGFQADNSPTTDSPPAAGG